MKTNATTNTFFAVTSLLALNALVAFNWPQYPVIVFEIVAGVSTLVSFVLAVLTLIYVFANKSTFWRPFAVLGMVLSPFVYGFVIFVEFFMAEGLAMGNNT